MRVQGPWTATCMVLTTSCNISSWLHLVKWYQRAVVLRCFHLVCIWQELFSSASYYQRLKPWFLKNYWKKDLKTAKLLQQTAYSIVYPWKIWCRYALHHSGKIGSLLGLVPPVIDTPRSPLNKLSSCPGKHSSSSSSSSSSLDLLCLNRAGSIRNLTLFSEPAVSDASW